LYDSAVWAVADPDYQNGTDPLGDAGAPEPLLFLPAGGIRHYYVGYVLDTGSYGYYWSSVVSGTTSYSMPFGSSRVGASDYYNRATGLSVRCIAE
jgi:hypothetical protein